MKQKSAISLLVCVIVLLVAGNLDITQAAQTSSNNVWIAESTADGLNFYVSNEEGVLQLKGTLSDFGVEQSIGVEWLIPSIHSFIVSPNKQQIAFPAKNRDGFGLFIYIPDANTLLQKRIAFPFAITWSPDGSALLLTPKFGLSGEIPSEPPHPLIYDMTTEQFTELVVKGGGLEWLPGSDGFVFLSQPVNCQGNCPGSDIYVMNRTGQNVHSLTHVYTDAAAIYPPNSCRQTWFPSNNRFYYVVGCAGFRDTPNDYLYSVDLNGNNRLELALPSLFSEDTFANIIRSLDVISTNVFITYQVDILSHAPHWRVLSLSTSGLIQKIFDYPFANDAELYEAKISSSGQNVALVGLVRDTSRNSNSIIVGNLTNGEVVTIVNRETDYICNIYWEDNQHLLYEIHELHCDADQSKPNAILQLDITDNSTTNLTQNLGNLAWLLPVTEILNESNSSSSILHSVTSSNNSSLLTELPI